MRTKVLFFAESVTTAQVTRLATLARCLAPERYEVHFASARFDPLVFGDDCFERHAVTSVDAGAAARALRAGRRIYDVDTLRGYVAEERSLFERIRPALVVGDFRLSLAVSAPLAGVPHAALVNAYWNPGRLKESLPVPDHPILRILGERLTAKYFPRAAPRAFSHFAAPVNELRRKNGLSSIGGLPEVLNFADFVLYPDPPGLVPIASLPDGHEYLGYVPWSPGEVGAEALALVDERRPLVYVTLGSSGRLDVLPAVIEGLGALDVSVLLSTAGRDVPTALPPNFVAAPYVPGELAARRSAFVVSNGGSSTGYQALAEGTPVLGVPSNLDQYLAMSAVERAGAGLLLPARSVTAERVRDAASVLLDSNRYRQGAEAMKEGIARMSYVDRFTNFVERVTAPGVAGLSRLAAFVFVAAACLTPTDVKADPVVPSTNEVRFSLSVASPQGHVVCALFRRSGWLEKPVKWQRVAIRKGRADCVFSGVSPDTYAISAFHDENDNTKLDTNFIGIPMESWCTSRDAPAFFGPPSFGDAKFLYRGDIMRLPGALK